MKKYSRYSAHGGLAIVGKYERKEKMWEEIEQRVKIDQKVVKYKPTDKMKDEAINILTGGAGISEVNHRVRPDEGLQRAFGRNGCAEQSTISETFSACTSQNVTEMNEALRVIYQKHGSGYRHDYRQRFQLLDIDHSGLLCGKQAEGATTGYFPDHKNGRGRQLGRVIASEYDEIVFQKLYTGKVQLEKSLCELVEAAEKVLNLDEVRRARTIYRSDGGGGTDYNINWLLERYYQVLAKVKNWQRTRALVETVTTWTPDPQQPNHELGWVTQPHAYRIPTHQVAVRWKEKGEWHYSVIVSTLNDDALAQLVRRPSQILSSQQRLEMIAWAYDLRGGGVECSFRNSKSGLYLPKRNKHSFCAQEMLVLVAQWVQNLVVWVRQICPELAKYGVLRMVRDVFHIPGRITMDQNHRLISIRLNSAHDLAKDFVTNFSKILPLSELSLYLGKI
jgi:hypothetical protein